MTNAMIILLESVKLMEDGVIKGSGIFGETPDGKKIELPEAIHTYAKWKSLGYQVKKGQKAKTQFPIWKYTKGKRKEAEEMDEKEAEAKGYCFMKMSSFFTKDQVEPIKRKEVV